MGVKLSGQTSSSVLERVTLPPVYIIVGQNKDGSACLIGQDPESDYPTLNGSMPYAYICRDASSALNMLERSRCWDTYYGADKVDFEKPFVAKEVVWTLDVYTPTNPGTFKLAADVIEAVRDVDGKVGSGAIGKDNGVLFKAEILKQSPLSGIFQEAAGDVYVAAGWLGGDDALRFVHNMLYEPRLNGGSFSDSFYAVDHAVKATKYASPLLCMRDLYAAYMAGKLSLPHGIAKAGYSVSERHLTREALGLICLAEERAKLSPETRALMARPA